MATVVRAAVFALAVAAAVVAAEVRCEALEAAATCQSGPHGHHPPTSHRSWQHTQDPDVCAQLCSSEAHAVGAKGGCCQWDGRRGACRLVVSREARPRLATSHAPPFLFASLCARTHQSAASCPAALRPSQLGPGVPLAPSPSELGGVSFLLYEPPSAASLLSQLEEFLLGVRWAAALRRALVVPEVCSPATAFTQSSCIGISQLIHLRQVVRRSGVQLVEASTARLLGVGPRATTIHVVSSELSGMTDLPTDHAPLFLGSLGVDSRGLVRVAVDQLKNVGACEHPVLAFTRLVLLEDLDTSLQFPDAAMTVAGLLPSPLVARLAANITTEGGLSEFVSCLRVRPQRDVTCEELRRWCGNGVEAPSRETNCAPPAGLDTALAAFALSEVGGLSTDAVLVVTNAHASSAKVLLVDGGEEGGAELALGALAKRVQQEAGGGLTTAQALVLADAFTLFLCSETWTASVRPYFVELSSSPASHPKIPLDVSKLANVPGVVEACQRPCDCQRTVPSPLSRDQMRKGPAEVCSQQAEATHHGARAGSRWPYQGIATVEDCMQLCTRVPLCGGYHYQAPQFSAHFGVPGHCYLHRSGKVVQSADTRPGTVAGHCTQKATCVLSPNQRPSSQHTAEPPSPQYLLYQPQFGLGNQLIALGIALEWARALGRILVIPHILFPRATSDVVALRSSWVPYGSVFDLLGLKSAHPDVELMEMDEFLALGLAPHIVHNAFLDVSDAVEWSDVYFSQLGFPETAARVMAGLQKNLHAEDVTQLYGACDAQVLAVSSMFHNLAQTTDFEAGLARLSRPAERLARVASRVATESGPAPVGGKTSLALCVHIRRGDFEEYCRDLAATCPQWAASLRQQGFACFPPIDKIVGDVVDILQERLASGTDQSPRVVVLSDSPETADQLVASADALLQGQAVWITEDVVGKEVRNTGGIAAGSHALVSAVVQQLLCANSDHVVLNRFSTFSKSVLRLREHRPVAYWTYRSSELAASKLEGCVVG